jgi:hypothetical protein
MAANGSITAAEAEAEKAQPLGTEPSNKKAAIAGGR